MNAIVSAPSRDVGHLWAWRDRMGSLHRPRDMETRHLFYTLRMIWNNTLPEEMRVGEVRLYTFGPAYTPDYLREAVHQIGKELLTRGDLREDWRAQLREMQSWFPEFRIVSHGQIEAPLPRLEDKR